jgi:ADP-ribose pyrophosphatase YjhB (NUDIX family)
MDIPGLLEEIQTIARNGLAYSQNQFDRERYERLLELSCGQYAELLDLPSAEVKAKLSQELGHITPKVGSDAAIFNQAGEMLLMERSDGTGWCMPCGWVEPNERPVDAAVRETREETGLEVAARRLVGVFSRAAGTKDTLHSQIAVVHLCEVVGGELTLSHEGLDLRYWALDEVPKWHGHHERMARAAHAMWLSGGTAPSVSE